MAGNRFEKQKHARKSWISGWIAGCKPSGTHDHFSTCASQHKRQCGRFGDSGNHLARTAMEWTPPGGVDWMSRFTWRVAVGGVARMAGIETTRDYGGYEVFPKWGVMDRWPSRENKQPAPVSRSGPIENRTAYFRFRRNSSRDDPLSASRANVDGSGTVIVYWSRTVSLN